MPEGPTIVLMKEDLQKFVGEKVMDVDGSEIPKESEVKGEILREIKTFGKQTYLIFDKIIFKIHLMMFGSYSLYERKDIDTLKLGLKFKDGGMYFYTCVVKIVDESHLNKINWEADVMSRKWNPEKTEKTLVENSKMMICDALMNQDIFSGVGNIIKNEALLRARIHPESLIGKLPSKKLKEIIEEARNYSFDFKKWKKANVLSKNFKIYHQKNCPICGAEVIKKDTGKSKRTSFFCENDQKLY
ncbi:DNA-formamidopyrimidine glycosylase family protein [Chryseobacterium indoltheticum]|uniref:Endonuclease-8 n=1 Tax=Chryseobacterium indoltheticum TaxID=254 RepID=A0A381FDH4_9FLAO|nr:DNA-formamidopyrimidine glycosylase family protein [Chryseobacterium indoltheticum]AZA74061.1 endonuclease [Chryseobacterium indoltheticum]SIQ22257.1 endonuclease-8 [Chryseobacterium indoltheticum]SUX44601.1 Formamidopyrimidine-DNA glycosylase [Chryseobacterium indoltheticum]